MSPSLRSLVLSTCFCGLAASCPDEVCVSGLEAYRNLFDGTYEKQSEGVYHQQYGSYGLLDNGGIWNLVDKGETAAVVRFSSYFKSVSTSACPSGASYRGANGKDIPMKVGTCDSDDEDSTGGSVGGAVGGLVFFSSIVACVAFCCWRRCRPGQGEASIVAVPAAVGKPVVVVPGGGPVIGAAQPVGGVPDGGPVIVAVQPVGAMAQPAAEEKAEAAEKAPCHNLKLTTFWKMTWCVNCKAMLLGLSKQKLNLNTAC